MLNKIPEARPGSLEMDMDAAITWRHMAPPSVTFEDVQRPDYWRNVVKEAGQQRIKSKHAWNKIEVLAEDGTWECMLRVMSAADGLVHTRVIYHVAAKASPGRKPNVPTGYQVEFIPNSGWRALDRHGELVSSRLETEEQAARAAAAHAKAAKAESNA